MNKLPMVARGEMWVPLQTAQSMAVELSTDAVPKGTLKLTTDTVSIHDLIRVYSDQEDGGIYRVVSVTGDAQKGITAQVLGAVDTLSDDLYNAKSDDITKSANAWITEILSKQTTQRWQLGACDMAEQVTLKIEYTTLWDLLEAIRNSQEGYRWTYNYNTSPWTLSLTKMSDDVQCGFALSRNLESLQVQRTDADFANRIYFCVTDASGSPVTVYNDTQSQSKYGIRTRPISVKQDDIPTGYTADQYARELLALYSVPGYSVQISGVDLKSITGDNFDRIKLGTKCLVRVPDEALPISERVVSLSWPDALGTPDRVRVSLATQIPQVSMSLAGAIALADAVKASTSARKKSSSKKKSSYWSQVLTDTIKAVDGTGIDQLWSSGIEMTAQGGVRIFSLYQGLEALDAEITVNAGAITSEVTRATAAEGVMSSRITQTADAITTEVTRATQAEGVLQSSIQQTADAIRLKVSKGDVATQLAVEVGNVTIANGDLVVEGAIIVKDGIASFDGTLQVDTVEARYGEIDYISALNTSTNVLNLADEMYIGSEQSPFTMKTFTVDGTQLTKFVGTQNVNFNVADTQTYKDGVAAAKKSMGLVIDPESGNVIAQVSTKKTVPIGASISSIAYDSTTHKYTVTAKALAGTTYMDTKVSYSGTEAYDAGLAAGQTTKVAYTATGTPMIYASANGAEYITVSSGANYRIDDTTGYLHVTPYAYLHTDDGTLVRTITGSGLTITSTYDAGYIAGRTTGQNDVGFDQPAWSGDGTTASTRLRITLSNRKEETFEFALTQVNGYVVLTCNQSARATLQIT